MANIYETLIRVNPPGSNELFSYVLATDHSASADGLEYTFTLRKGVKFHDGTPFTAEAVKFSIDRTKKLGKGASFIWSDLKDIEIVDDFTVKFILGKPVPARVDTGVLVVTSENLESPAAQRLLHPPLDEYLPGRE